MIEYSSFALDNGLRVVHTHDGATPMVAVNVLYKVGARDDPEEHTGMAHLLEHLMFGGSANVRDYDRELELAGGTNNAWTSNDYTDFHDVIPAQNIETALWAESDRMMSATLGGRVLEVQKSVVTEEFKQSHLNRPYGDVNHLVRAMLYKRHPYRWPTIGLNTEGIDSITEEDVRKFFDTYYSPDNAVLSIAGNLSEGRARELAEKWFGSIPPRGNQRAACPREPEQTAARRLEVERDVSSSAMVIAFPMCGYGEPLYEAADILTDILSTGTSSRFHRELVMKECAVAEADASISGSDDPGYLTINLRSRDNSSRTLEEAEKLVWHELDRIVCDGVTEYELERAKNKFESNLVFSHVGYPARAQALGISGAHGEDINSILPAYRKLTPGDINEAARRFLRRDRSNTLVYKSVRESSTEART